MRALSSASRHGKKVNDLEGVPSKTQVVEKLRLYQAPGIAR
jgi:hypothetical protein